MFQDKNSWYSSYPETRNEKEMKGWNGVRAIHQISIKYSKYVITYIRTPGSVSKLMQPAAAVVWFKQHLEGVCRQSLLTGRST